MGKPTLGWGVALRGGVDGAERVEGAGHRWVGVCLTLHTAGRVRWEWGELGKAGAPPTAGDPAAGCEPRDPDIAGPWAPELTPWPCSPEDLPQSPSCGPESGRRDVSMFTNTRLPKVSAEAWTPASSWHQGCLLPRSQVPLGARARLGGRDAIWEPCAQLAAWGALCPPPSSVHGGGGALRDS